MLLIRCFEAKQATKNQTQVRLECAGDGGHGN